jgi:predicted nucleic acid binding AN1-type Zn finger protein
MSFVSLDLERIRKMIEEKNLAAPTEAPTATKPTRCCLDGCKKKLLLSDFACRCGGTFCSLHRISESHACRFDYRQDNRNNLLKTMSTAIVGKKIDTI